MFQEQARVGPS